MRYLSAIFLLIVGNVTSLSWNGDEEVPPFTYSIDQSIPCPVGCGQDFYEEVNETTPEIREILESVPSFLRLQMKRLGSPSAGLVVVRNGHVILSEYAGSSNLTDPNANLSENSVFQIASITKTFTVATLFHMRDRGMLPEGLDTPVSSLLPNFSVRSPYSSSRPITLRALAMQTSGLPREIPHYEAGSTAEDTEQRVLRAVANLTVLSGMYESPHYSNLGLALLGRAIEKTANVSWETYLRDEILKPLRLFDTGNPGDFKLSPDVRRRVIDGVAVPNGTKAVPISESNSWGGACGSMHSSFRDMAMWTKFLMDSGTPNERERFRAVIDPATRAEMRNTGYVMGDALSSISSGVLEGAFMQGRWTQNKLGCVEGYRSDMSLVPSLGLTMFGVATSTCDLYGDGDAIVFPIASKLVREIASELSDFQRPLPPKDVLDNVLGSYCSDIPSNALTISVERHNVVMRPPNGQPYAFVLRYIGNASKEDYGEVASQWRLVMGPEKWLSPDLPGCTAPVDSSSGNDGLCPISCMRKMGRGSGELAFFYVDDMPGPNQGRFVMSIPGSGQRCYREE
eukprot:g1219.t1